MDPEAPWGVGVLGAGAGFGTFNRCISALALIDIARFDRCISAVALIHI